MDEINKNAVFLAVEKALLEMGQVELKMVESKLKNEHNIELSNCLEHPIFLKQVLCELFGNSYEDILRSIEDTFEKFTPDAKMMEFIITLRR